MALERKQIKSAQFDNGETIPSALPTNGTTYYDATISASTDPFAGKTKKYAEGGDGAIVEITAIDKSINAVWSKDGLTAATNATGYLIPANTTRIFTIADGYKYLRVIQTTATAQVSVVEYL